MLLRKNPKILSRFITKQILKEYKNWLEFDIILI